MSSWSLTAFMCGLSSKHMTALSLLQFFVVEEAAGYVQVDEVPCERLSKESSFHGLNHQLCTYLVSWSPFAGVSRFALESDLKRSTTPMMTRVDLVWKSGSTEFWKHETRGKNLLKNSKGGNHLRIFFFDKRKKVRKRGVAYKSKQSRERSRTR